MKLLSDTIQIVQISPDSLQVYFPLRHPGGIVFLVLAVVSSVVAAKLPGRKLILGFVMGTAFLLAGLDFCTYHAIVTLSAKTQTFAYEERTFYYRTSKTYPLSSLEEAVVMAGSSQNRLMALLVDSGPKITPGDGYNSRGNQFEAAHAINTFLVRNGRK